jgi:ADP-ribose pyrophosphatase YjhB (NUDIX family)
MPQADGPSEHPREYPPHPLVGVGTVVFRGDDVLLVRRGRPPKQGEWSLPGGLQRLGETVFQAAVREVREEANIGIRVLGIVDVVDLIERETASARIRYHYTLIDVIAEWVEGAVQPGSDAADAGWFAHAELPAQQLWAETRRVVALAERLRHALAPRPGLA